MGYTKRPDIEIMKLHIENGMSMVNISKIYGVAPMTVTNWCKSYGINHTKEQKLAILSGPKSTVESNIEMCQEIANRTVKVHVGDKVRLTAEYQDSEGCFKPHSRNVTVKAKHRDHIVFDTGLYCVSVQNKDLKMGAARLEKI